MTALRVFLARLVATFRAGRVDREMNAEIASHLDEATAEFIGQGLAPDAARDAALRSFGGVIHAMESHREVRSFRWLEDFRQDLRYAVRILAKNPGFSLVATLTLALGIGANTAIFTLLDAVVLKPLSVPAVSELFTLYENGPEGPADAAGGTGQFLVFSYPRFERLRRALGAHGSLAAVTRSSQFVVRLRGNATPQFARAQLVTGGYFSTLGVSARRGRVLTDDDVRPDQGMPAAVVSDGFWRRTLGASDAALGQTLVVNGVTVNIVGIAPPGFVGMWTDAEAEIWLPVTLQSPMRYRRNSSSYGTFPDEQPWLEQDLVAWLNIVARVPAAERSQAISELQAADQVGLATLAATFEDPKERTSTLAHTLAVEPFSRGFSLLRARYSEALFALSGLVVLVLLVTCANIANLLLTRAAGHARDIGIRISLGATTSRLVRQCLTESLVLALAGGTLGVLLGEAASRFLAREVLGRADQLPEIFSPDRRVLIFSGCVSLITAVVFGLAPAARAITLGRQAALPANQRQAVGHKATTGMRWLVAGQLALSVVLVFAALVLGRTLINVMRIDPGFSADHLVTVSFDPVTSLYPADQTTALSRRLVAAASSLPGVMSAAVSRCGLVAGCASSSGYRVDGQGSRITFYSNWVTPGYFQTVGIPLLAGREFTERDTARGPKVAIINETIARRFFAGQNPIGRRLGSSELDTEIVGVARDAHTQTVHDAPVPMVYMPVDQKAVSRQTALTNLDVRVAGDAGAMVSAVREAIRRAEPNLLVSDVGTMSLRLERDLTRERIVAFLAFGFGALTLLLASLGLYGVISYGVTRRTQEIGVRLALGAQRSEVLGFVLGQSAWLIVVGIVIGLAATAACARFLSGMLFGVTPLDPVALALVCLAFGCVTLVASFVPARRASRLDPVIALRSE